MTGEQLKDEGIERVQDNNSQWIWDAQYAITLLSSRQSEFTTDDLKDCMHSDPPHPNCIGAAFNCASRDGIIKRVGYRKSTSPSAHGRVVSVWEKA